MLHRNDHMVVEFFLLFVLVAIAAMFVMTMVAVVLVACIADVNIDGRRDAMSVCVGGTAGVMPSDGVCDTEANGK